MKLSVIALDYDGTVARDGVLDPSVRDAIASARTEGIIVLLVTGRILDELRRDAGDLHFVDGVIAENGAVIHFPRQRTHLGAAPLVPEASWPNCAGAGSPLTPDSASSTRTPTRLPRLLEVIRTLELPLVLIFNRGRVMTLPQGVSKATGLHVALETLRLSPRNTVRDWRRRKRPRASAAGGSRSRGRMGQQGAAGGRRCRLDGAGPAAVGGLSYAGGVRSCRSPRAAAGGSCSVPGGRSRILARVAAATCWSPATPGPENPGWPGSSASN